MARPTIRTVAERAGVSKSLVSLVLRDSPHVSPERRAAVLKAIEELGYRPHAAARALSEARARAVGVLISDLRNPWYLPALEGLYAVLGRAGLQLLLADHRLDVAGGETFVRTMLEMRPDGIVLIGSIKPSEAIAEAAREFTTVVLGNRDLDFPGVPVINVDDEAGGRLGVRHLVERGHTRIGTIAVPTTTIGRIRLAGYTAEMTEQGLAEHIQVEPAEATEASGYRAAIRLLAGTPRPTALACHNDLTALGALSAARDLGIRVPDELSVVGCDNTYLAELGHVDLTTVDIASREIGERAAALILSPERPAGGLHLVPPSMTVRGTTGPAPRA